MVFLVNRHSPYSRSLLACSTLALVLSLSTTLYADTKFSAGMTDSPEPKKMWDRSIAKPTEYFQLLRPWGEDKKKEELPVQLQAAAPKNETPAEESTPREKEPEMVGETRESIIARYGDPEAEAVIVPDQKAPKPFKAIHAAMQIGDEELAFQFARKHVRYLAGFKERMEDLTGLVGTAMEVEGVSDGEGWTSAPEFDKYRKYVEAAEQEKMENDKPIYDEFVYALPKEHQLRAITPFSDATQYDHQREAEHREIFRRHFQAIAPVSTDGKVDLVLYVDPVGDKQSLIAARELSKLGNNALRNPDITFSIKATKFFPGDELSAFASQSRNYSAKTGYVKHDEQKIESVPMLKISIPSIKKEWELRGVRRNYFYEELVSVMHGKGIR